MLSCLLLEPPGMASSGCDQFLCKALKMYCLAPYLLSNRRPLFKVLGHILSRWLVEVES
jgi:hypothetical protein